MRVLTDIRNLRSLRRARRVRAFSLVEVLVVVAIIALLATLVIKGSSSLFGQSRATNTRGAFASVDQAIQAFRQEVDTARMPNYQAVFRGAPPDNLYAFFGDGSVGGCRVAIAQGDFVDAGGNAVDVDTLMGDGTGSSRALLLAIALRSPKGQEIVSRFSDRYTSEGETKVYFDDGATRIPVPYLVDDWGQPVEYFATRVCDASGATTRDVASNTFINWSGGDELLVSYGDNGIDQYAGDLGADGQRLFPDFQDDSLINSRLNDDNVYSSVKFAGKVRQ